MSQTSVLLQTRLNADSSLLESFGHGSKSTKFAASKRQSYWHCRSIASWRAHFKETSFSRFSSTLYPREKNMEKRDSTLISRSLQAYWSLEKDCPHDKTIYHLYHLTISHTLRLFLNQACPFKISSLTKVFELSFSDTSLSDTFQSCWTQLQYIVNIEHISLRSLYLSYVMYM